MKPLRDWLGRTYEQARYLVLHQILHTDDPPHRLAMGVGVAMFVTFTPTVGFQMLLVVFLAWLFRANKVIGIPLVWISNPATMVPIYYAGYRLGTIMLGWKVVGKDWWNELAKPTVGGWELVGLYWRKFWEISTPLWAGSLVISLVLGYISYHVSHYMICAYRMRRWGQLTKPMEDPKKEKEETESESGESV